MRTPYFSHLAVQSQTKPLWQMVLKQKYIAKIKTVDILFCPRFFFVFKSRVIFVFESKIVFGQYCSCTCQSCFQHIFLILIRIQFGHSNSSRVVFFNLNSFWGPFSKFSSLELVSGFKPDLSLFGSLIFLFLSLFLFLFLSLFSFYLSCCVLKTIA